ncbi:hypothetical protein Micbo1qcDRAFT_200431 [Microdochium bolleyi]|uniref:Uncharacterized protein n=1 Tax=Microdochium bolleyi TaxID=196109 RepID=A0A136JCV8_9PEZI|nr:hypothetical protein Micbo1qcDRAFT_200431 [Microdochium bolleyi]
MSRLHDARRTLWAILERCVADNVIAAARRSFSGNHVKMTARKYSMQPKVGSYAYVDYGHPPAHFFGALATQGISKTLETRQSFPEGRCDYSKYNGPRSISEHYGIDHVPAARSASTLTVAGFLEQFLSREDWSLFNGKVVGTT